MERIKLEKDEYDEGITAHHILILFPLFMSEILKHSGLYLLLAISLISSLSLDVVAGDSEEDITSNNTTALDDFFDTDIEIENGIIDENSMDIAAIIDEDPTDSTTAIDIERIIDPTIFRDAGHIAYMGSFDKRTVSSYSDGSMALGNQMESAFEMAENGITKTHKAITISYGSELLQMEEISKFAGYDTFGNEFSANYGKFTTLKNFDFPFALIRDDEIAISGEDLSIKKTQAETILVIPDWIDTDSLDKIKSALGSSADIKEVKYTLGADSLDLTPFFLSATEAGINISTMNLDALFGATMNKAAWEALHQAALEAKRQQENPPTADEWNMDDFSLSSGGIKCIWGYKS